MSVDFQSYAGPGDRGLRMNEVSGYQPVSRIGEVVMNAFVDAFEFTDLGKNSEKLSEPRPHFYEWATVQPGMICVARKKKTQTFRGYQAAETAVPVIACAALLSKSEEANYFFAGIARSKSVRTPDDGIGANVDEYFTVSIGGMQTILNTSGQPISPGDLIEWTFEPLSSAPARTDLAPKRIAVQIASVSSPRTIGRALSFAKRGETYNGI